MLGNIQRSVVTVATTIPSGQALSGAIALGGMAGGVLSMPAVWTAAKIGFQHCASPTGTFQPLYTDAGALVEINAAAAGEYALPDALFGAGYIKLWSESASVAVNQAADRAITLTLKG